MPILPEAAFEDHRAQVYAWAYRLVQNHHDALDVTQEVFIKWWRATSDGSAPGGNPLGWLRRVTVNLAIDAVRSAARKASRRPAAGPAVADAPDPVRRETARRIAEALQTLTERQRCVVVAKVYDGCTFARIAGQLGTSIPTVKTHYLRALQTLRQKLGDAQSCRPAPPGRRGSNLDRLEQDERRS